MERRTNHVHRRRNGRIDSRHRLDRRVHEEMIPMDRDEIWVVLNDDMNGMIRRSIGAETNNRSD